MESEDWAQLRTTIYDAGHVPEAVCRMLTASSAEEADKAYWMVDNRVVVQGQLFEAAPATTLFLLREICAGRYTEEGLMWGLDLLVELTCGESDHMEVLLGNNDLGDACRRHVVGYVDCLMGLVDASAADRTLLGVIDVVDRLEEELGSSPVRSALIRALSEKELSPALIERLHEFSTARVVTVPAGNFVRSRRGLGGEAMKSEDWAQLRAIIHDASYVPRAVCEVLTASSAEEAKVAYRRAAYWRVGNSVVEQTQLFEAAPATTLFLLREICAGRYTEEGLMWGLDLLVRLTYGESHYMEVLLGNNDLGDACRRHVVGYVDCLIGLVDTSSADRTLLGVIDVVDRLEEFGSPVRSALIRALSEKELSPELIERLHEFSTARIDYDH